MRPWMLVASLLAARTAAAATVTVDGTRTTGTLARDTVGLSYEMRTVGEGGFDALTGNEAALFATLGVHHLRIGGNTVDYGTFWQKAGSRCRAGPASSSPPRTPTGWRPSRGPSMPGWPGR